MASVNNITTATPHDTQARLFKIANQVALKNAREYNWSTWHSWDVVDDAEAKHQFGLRGMDRYFWSLTGRFGTCLGASTRIVAQLQGELAAHSNKSLSQYANTVQLMTSARHATADNKYHAVVTMCFDTFAIVIDHALHPAAFKVLLGGISDMAPYVPLFGEPGQERFKYFLEDCKYKLTMDNEQGTYPSVLFSEMDIDKATNQLAIPAALEVQPVKGQEHILLPSRKYLSVRSLLDRAPQLIAAERVDDG